MRRLDKVVLRVLVCIAFLSTQLVWSQAPVRAQGVDVPEFRAGELAEFKRAVDLHFESLQAINEAVDGRRYTIEGRVALLGGQIEKIIDFVTHEIGFEPYVGSLRGPLGTLQSRSGNALDQARLLATMLELSGREVRIATAELTTQAHTRLTAATFEGRPTRESAGPPAALTARLSALYGVSEANIETQFSDFDANRREQDTALHEQVGRLAAALEETVPRAASAQLQLPGLPIDVNHYFVQYFSEGTWVSVDPTGAFEGRAPQATSTFATDGLPDDVFHTFGAKLMLRTAAGGGEVEDSALIDTVLRTPDLYGTPVMIAVIPPATEDEDEFSTAIAYGTTLTGGGTFTLAGFVDDLPPPSEGSPEPKFGLTFPDLEEQMAEPKDIVGLWIEYTLSAPDGTRETHHRDLVPVSQTMSWSDGLAEQHTSSWTHDQLRNILPWTVDLYVMSGTTPEDYETYAAMQAGLDTRGMYDQVFAFLQDGTQPDVDETQTPMLALSPLHGAAMRLASEYDRLLSASAGEGGSHVRLIRPFAGLIGFEERIFEQEGEGYATSVGYDVIADGDRAVVPEGGGGQAIAMYNLRRGVLWTALERALMQPGFSYPQAELQEPIADVAENNAAYLLERVLSNEQGQLIYVDANADWAAILQSLDMFNAGEKASITRELQSGHSIVLQQAPGEISGQWWRYNPDTGFILGVSAMGRGASDEYLINTTILGMRLIVTTKRFIAWLIVSQLLYQVCLLVISDFAPSTTGGTGAVYCGLTAHLVGFGASASVAAAVRAGVVAALAVIYRLHKRG